MPYEVIKQIGGRAYRYQVERYRDPDSGKVRARWTYLGKAEGSLPAQGRRRPAAITRERLIDAVVQLAERVPWPDFSADAVAREAGLAHGTFYRYFRDRRSALLAAFEEWRKEIDRERPELDREIGTRAAERERLAAWVRSLVGAPLHRPGLFRAWFELAVEDQAHAAVHNERVESVLGGLADYLRRLGDAGLITPPGDPIDFARALFFAVQGVYHGGAVAGSTETTTRLIVELFDRAVFFGSSDQ